ncbi:MAG TPA: hypothetical protein VMT18_06815 [Planctomycetota bacterium]|nr:hypothetical protein [Planctomycetota bacterium]
MQRFRRFPSAAVLALSAAGLASAQSTSLVSVGAGGVQGDGPSLSPALSAGGRYVAFESSAENLVPGDTNHAQDVFVRDRVLGVTTRVSVSSSGAQANWNSYSPSISADGRFVAFTTLAANLVPGDDNGVIDVFVHDRLSGTTERVSVDSAGALGDGDGRYPTLSADGRYVCFESLSTNLVAGDTNDVEDIFVRDRLLGLTTRVSVGPGGVQGNGRSLRAGICADGRRVVFVSAATNLVAGDTNGAGQDCFVRDLELGLTLCASLTPGGMTGNGVCDYPAISGNGRVVGFESAASDLVAGDTNGVADSFARDLDAGRTTRVSVGPGGVQGDSLSLRAVPSFDGRFVAFKSQAANLVPGDTNGVQDVFLHDVRRGTTVRVTLGPGSAQSLGWSSQPALSADGRQVAFYSFAEDLVVGDGNAVPDAFVRTLW